MSAEPDYRSMLDYALGIDADQEAANVAYVEALVARHSRFVPLSPRAQAARRPRPAVVVLDEYKRRRPRASEATENLTPLERLAFDNVTADDVAEMVRVSHMPDPEPSEAEGTTAWCVMPGLLDEAYAEVDAWHAFGHNRPIQDDERLPFERPRRPWSTARPRVKPYRQAWSDADARARAMAANASRRRQQAVAFDLDRIGRVIA